jgi:hypothetical protein
LMWGYCDALLVSLVTFVVLKILDLSKVCTTFRN